MRHGEGNCHYNSDNSRYMGLWQNNLPHKGKLILTDGTVYDGDWKDDMFSGVGSITYANGDTYQGEWKQYRPHHYGVQAYRNGRIYTGEWQLGVKHGNGTMTYPNGDKYEGSWVNDQRNGYGTFRLQRGDIYEGEWKEDMQHGHGKLIHYEGSTYEGTWERGNKVDQGGVYTNPTTKLPLKVTDYRLKEQYRVPSEYLNSQDRLQSIQVDSAYIDNQIGQNNPQ